MSKVEKRAKLNLKGKNGITLLALIVSILVLLILVGISISMLIGQNSVTNNAAKAKKVTKYGEIEDKIELAIAAACITEDDTVDETKFRNELGRLLGVEGEDYIIYNLSARGWMVYFSSEEKVYLVNREGELSEQDINCVKSVLGYVDYLGTRATIYLYNNIFITTPGKNITITMPDNTQKVITTLSDTSNISSDANYATYTVEKNGKYTFKFDVENEEREEATIEVKNIEKFTSIETLASEQGLSYAGEKTNAYSYKGAVVPKGYYVDTASNVATGLIVTDAIDSEGYSTGNEWVWVPVNSTVGNDDYYGEESSATALAGATDVTYTKYSKLYSFMDKTRENYGTFHAYGKNTKTLSRPSTSSNAKYREIAILNNTSYGETGKYNLVNSRATGTAFSNVTDVATQYVTDYDNMVASVDNYKGFYIGRYEITSNGIKPGNSLTDCNWYTLYNQCLTYGTDYTESGMIYGCLWDATMQWLAKSDISVGYTVNTYSGYGNHPLETVIVNNKDVAIIVKAQNTSRKLQTGQTSYTKSNNIYDLSGNCTELTQEASDTYDRVRQGAAISRITIVTIIIRLPAPTPIQRVPTIASLLAPTFI